MTSSSAPFSQFWHQSGFASDAVVGIVSVESSSADENWSWDDFLDET
ncbi:hypothetical protein [Synechococcus sp. UW179A]|nr:hypothetical protein [Synechococcus sp. UW179A]